MELMQRRRELIGSNNIKPIFSIRDYDIRQGRLDTGISLIESWTKGYAIIANVDCSMNTATTVAIISGAGIYQQYCYFYPTRTPTVYGITGTLGPNFFPSNEGKDLSTWLELMCLSVNIKNTMGLAFLNDKPAISRALDSYQDSTETFKINPGNLRSAQIIVKKLEIYTCSMTENQMRKLARL